MKLSKGVQYTLHLSSLDVNHGFNLFPLNINFQRATYEIPFGFVERPTNGEEEPGQRHQGPAHVADRHAQRGRALLHAPELYDPIDRPSDNWYRRNYAIDQMVRYGYLPQKRGDRLKQVDCCGTIKDQSQRIYAPGQTEYFAEYVRQQLFDRYGEKRPATFVRRVHAISGGPTFAS